MRWHFIGSNFTFLQQLLAAKLHQILPSLEQPVLKHGTSYLDCHFQFDLLYYNILGKIII
jgi:hypothetical protein